MPEEKQDIKIDEEIIPEDGEGSVANPKDTIKDLREKLKKALVEKQEYLEGWQRTKADFVNARKRDEESRAEMIKFANENLIFELLPALDSFTIAFANKDAWEKVDKNWRQGVEYIYAQLLGSLEHAGLKQFDPRGEKFDPTRHTSLSSVAVTDESHNHMIIDVVQKGYTLNDKVIRPAQVKVGEYIVETSEVPQKK